MSYNNKAWHAFIRSVPPRMPSFLRLFSTMASRRRSKTIPFSKAINQWFERKIGIDRAIRLLKFRTFRNTLEREICQFLRAFIAFMIDDPWKENRKISPSAIFAISLAGHIVSTYSRGKVVDRRPSLTASFERASCSMTRRRNQPVKRAWC